jgi:two-component system, chemotaxis family, chemotaxis protein CheY
MSKRVLVCDDSLLMRSMVADCLSANGWEIVGFAKNGLEAVEQFKTLRPDAVTMDVVMPEYDGLYGLEEILKVDAGAKVVVLSALDQTQTICDAIRRGAQDFLAKPFMPEQLQKTLESCVGA